MKIGDKRSNHPYDTNNIIVVFRSNIDNYIKSHPASATPHHTIIQLALDQKSVVSVIIP